MEKTEKVVCVKSSTNNLNTESRNVNPGAVKKDLIPTLSSTSSSSKSMEVDLLDRPAALPGEKKKQ